MSTSKYVTAFLYGCYIVFFVSLVFSFRGFASIGIALILLTGIIKNKIETGSSFNSQVKNSFLLACTLFFLLQSGLLLLAPDTAGSEKIIQLKSGLLFVPLSVCCSNYLNKAVYHTLMKFFILILSAALLFCLFNAGYQYFFFQQQNSVFFYHSLVSPFHQHAVQVSILLFIGFIHLLETAKKVMFVFNRLLHLTLIFYFTGLILLLSSKLVIICTCACLLYYLFLYFKTAVKLRIISIIALVTGLLMIAFVLTSNNQVSKRFNEIMDSNLDLVQQKIFDPGVYFNGLQFRLLQVRFVKEILDEKQAWLTGVSNRSQQLLVEKYVSTHMYLGDGKKDYGYTKYNTHNQFLEALLQSGIAGFIAYSLIFFALIGLMVKRKSRELFFIGCLLLAYSLNESVLERQYSIMLFTFFPLLAYFSKNNSTDRSANKSKLIAS